MKCYFIMLGASLLTLLAAGVFGIILAVGAIIDYRRRR